MKWSPVLLLIITLLTLLAGCELGTHTYYFYSWAVDDEEPAYELTYRKDGYTIIMSRGRGGFDLDKGEAEGLIGYTEFTLKLNDEELEPIDEKSVAKLDNGWHVVQTFKTGTLSRGTYTLEGTSILTGEDEGTRVNTVLLTIK